MCVFDIITQIELGSVSLISILEEFVKQFCWQLLMYYFVALAVELFGPGTFLQ